MEANAGCIKGSKLMIKVAIFENGQLVKYNFPTMKAFDDAVAIWKLKFKKENSCDDNDRAYMAYCEELHEMKERVANKSEDYHQCMKCPPEKHEGAFCRCEDRNIRIAKERRSNKEDHWKKKE